MHLVGRMACYEKLKRPMNILVVYPYIPFPIDRGTYQRVFHLLRALAMDHTIDLIALSEKGERVENRGIFESFCRKVVFVPFEHPPWPRLFPNRLLNSLPTTIRHWWLPQLADTPQKFAHCTERMLLDEPLRQKIEEHGMETCHRRFGWPGLGRQLSSYYSQHFQPAKHSHEHN